MIWLNKVACFALESDVPKSTWNSSWIVRHYCALQLTMQSISSLALVSAGFIKSKGFSPLRAFKLHPPRLPRHRPGILISRQGPFLLPWLGKRFFGRGKNILKSKIFRDVMTILNERKQLKIVIRSVPDPVSFCFKNQADRPGLTALHVLFNF